LTNLISDSKTYEAIDAALSSQVKNLPPSFFLILLYIIILIIVVYWLVKIWKLYKAPGSELIQEYKQNLEKTNVDSQQKSLIMTLMDQVNKEIPELQKLYKYGNSEKLFCHGRKVIDMLIEQIPLALKSMKNINHRCAIFIIDEENNQQLKIFEGCGYSIQGKENLRLDFNSVAGKVFTNGEYKYCKDITKDGAFKPHPKASKTYYSLLCVPIKIRSKTVAVLSIDGSDKDCFTKDDINYFQMFSNQIAIILDLMEINDYQGGIEHEIQNIG
jgi:transcriptional regulator with GAF, ATPase, and Fis domain